MIQQPPKCDLLIGCVLRIRDLPASEKSVHIRIQIEQPPLDQLERGNRCHELGGRSDFEQRFLRDGLIGPGFPITVGSIPVAAAKAAKMLPVPGINPFGVGSV